MRTEKKLPRFPQNRWGTFEMDCASASRGADRAFGVAAISVSMVAVRAGVMFQRAETYVGKTCSARVAVSAPTSGSASATASEPTTASGAGTAGARTPPLHEHLRLTSTWRPPPPRQRWNPTRERGGDCSAAPVSPLARYPRLGERKCTCSTFLAPCSVLYDTSVGRQGQKLAGRGFYHVSPTVEPAGRQLVQYDFVRSTIPLS